jgi:hypothetical protein
METVISNEVVAVPSPGSGGGKNLLTGLWLAKSRVDV